MTVTIETGGPLAAPLDDLKTYLGISLDDEDVALTGLIRAASDVAERFLGRMLIARAVTEVRPAGRAWARLAMEPVRAITRMEGLPAEGAAFTMPMDNYAVDIDARGAGWVRVLNAGAAGRIRVTYLAGIAEEADEVPDGIRHAIVRLAGEYHARREGLEGELPASVVALLRPWRRTRLT